MVILHYLMGLPPVRGGGLVHYVLDLAKAQKEMGHSVFYWFPAVFPEWIQPGRR